VKLQRQATPHHHHIYFHLHTFIQLLQIKLNLNKPNVQRLNYSIKSQSRWKLEMSMTTSIQFILGKKIKMKKFFIRIIEQISIEENIKEIFFSFFLKFLTFTTIIVFRKSLHVTKHTDPEYYRFTLKSFQFNLRIF